MKVVRTWVSVTGTLSQQRRGWSVEGGEEGMGECGSGRRLYLNDLKDLNLRLCILGAFITSPLQPVFFH